VDDFRPGSKALRRGRASLPQHVYHLRFVTKNRQAIFHDLGLGRLVARCLNDPALLGDARTLAWVVMPDHVHWLAQLGEKIDLEHCVSRFKSGSARTVNQGRDARGTLWQPGYYDHLVRDEENLRDVARYIVANPVRAGLVKRVGDYPLWDAIWLSDSLSVGAAHGREQGSA